jgi:HEAT repeat protein
MTTTRHHLSAARRIAGLVLILSTIIGPTAAQAGKAFEAKYTSGHQLLAYLDHPDWRFRVDATVEIAERRIVQAKPLLEELAADDPYDRVRRVALKALMDVFGGPSDRRILHEILLEANDPDFRYEIVRLIEDSPRAADRDALIAALSDDNPHVARHAARALVRIGDRDVAPILREKAMDVADRKVAEELNIAASRLGG